MADCRLKTQREAGYTLLQNASESTWRYVISAFGMATDAICWENCGSSSS
jgi:hypothetical protein